VANKPKFTKGVLLRAIRGDPTQAKPTSNQDDDAWIADLWVDDPRVSSYGHIPTIAARLGCTEQTVRNYANRRNKITGQLTRQAKDIQAAIDAEFTLGLERRADFHTELIRDAERALHENVKLLDTPSIRFALERLDKGHYAVRSEMTGADGKNLFDDEARQALAELGELLDNMGQNPSTTLIDAVNAMKAKLAEIKNKGKPDGEDKPLSTERGE
jgi:hypothetical protein